MDEILNVCLGIGMCREEKCWWVQNLWYQKASKCINLSQWFGTISTPTQYIDFVAQRLDSYMIFLQHIWNEHRVLINVTSNVIFSTLLFRRLSYQVQRMINLQMHRVFDSFKHPNKISSYSWVFHKDSKANFKSENASLSKSLASLSNIVSANCFCLHFFRSKPGLVDIFPVKLDCQNLKHRLHIFIFIGGVFFELVLQV